MKIQLLSLALVVISSACISGNFLAAGSDDILCPLVFENAFVSSVIDGDTIVLASGEKVRLTDINAPEKREHFYQNAKDFVANETERKNVTLGKGCNDKDDYGRMLRYVFVNGTETGNISNSVNLLLVKGGYATSYFYGYTDFKKDFSEAENYAKENKLGIWATSEFYGCISVKEIDAEKEFVILKNKCAPINLEGWTLKDESASHIYKLKSFVLSQNKETTIFTGIGANTETSYFLNQKITIWNNDGDTLFLRDKEGKLVLVYNYQ